MDDDITPDAPDERDERDERFAALLAVPPLDDVTRRRLVRTAADAAATSKRRPSGRLAAISAIAAALVVGVVAVGLSLGAEESTTTAARPSSDRATTTAGVPSTVPSAGESPSSPEAAGAPPVLDTTSGLPDLGEVAEPSRLATAVEADQAQDKTQSRQAFNAPCAVELEGGGLSNLEAVGLGTVDGQPVVVLRGVDDGAPVALAVDSTCDVLTRAQLEPR